MGEKDVDFCPLPPFSFNLIPNQAHMLLFKMLGIKLSCDPKVRERRRIGLEQSSHYQSANTLCPQQ